MKNIQEYIENKNKELKDLFKKTLSVSKLNEYLKEPFDEITMAENCYQKGLKDPTYKYAGMNVNEILTQWHDKANESKHYGRLLDEYTDLLFNKKDNDLELWKLNNNFNNDNRLNNYCKGIEQFIDFIILNTNYYYVGREIPIFYENKNGDKINGRLDFLLYDDNTDSYIIIDWKTTENITIKNNYNKHLLGPAYMLDECDMNLYTIQLHVYKKSLVETYRLAPYSRISVYVCNLLREPENGKYYKLFPQNFEFNNNRINAFINYGNLQLKLSRICKNEEKETVNE